MTQETLQSGAETWLDYHGNRASRILKAAFSEVSAQMVDVTEKTLFTYWDTYGGQPLELPDSDVRRVFQVVERRVTNPLANKRTLARNLAELGLSEWAPVTCESAADVMARPGWEQSVWFIKSVFGTGGKGMFCVRGDDVRTLQLQPDQIIQQGVESLSLIDGRKFTVRVYVLVWNRAVYLYGDGFAVVHGVPYQRGSTDYAVQIDHRGYEQTDSSVTLLPMHRYPDWETVSPRVRECIAALTPLLQPVIEASDETTYAVLGLDFLITDELDVKLIEINNMPNFIHNTEVNETVNVPFWRCVMRLLLSGSESSCADQTRLLHRV